LEFRVSSVYDCIFGGWRLFVVEDESDVLEEVEYFECREHKRLMGEGFIGIGGGENGDCFVVFDEFPSTYLSALLCELVVESVENDDGLGVFGGGVGLVVLQVCGLEEEVFEGILVDVDSYEVDGLIAGEGDIAVSESPIPCNDIHLLDGKDKLNMV
jgi:hypothetical protein